MFSRVSIRTRCFRLVSRGDQADRDEGDRRRPQGQGEDRAFAPPQRAPQRPDIELLDRGSKPVGQLRTRTHH